MWNKLQHPRPEKGLLFVSPNASHGMGQGPEKLFVGSFIAKENHRFCLHYLGNNVDGLPRSAWDEKPQME